MQAQSTIDTWNGLTNYQGAQEFMDLSRQELGADVTIEAAVAAYVRDLPDMFPDPDGEWTQDDLDAAAASLCAYLENTRGVEWDIPAEEVAAIEQQATDMTDINEIARRIEREFRADYDKICAALTAINERGDAIEYHGTVAAGLMQEHGTHVTGLTVPPLDAEVRARLLAQARELGSALHALKRQMQREMDALWPIR